MTGSFPVAFHAQKWKPEWGKYYVHYNKFRKEIDLTGHEFTDGGLLANFPIKYLDNEHMRPMYFSHRQDASKTILYGFGLDPIPDPNDNAK
jgi:predicted acylesterase/phospholipase RssA